MIYTGDIKIRNVIYKFDSVDEHNPLTSVMYIHEPIATDRNSAYELYREVNCDTPSEKWILIHRYTRISNGISSRAMTEHQVYMGRDITSESFITELLENVLVGFGLIPEKE